MISYSPAPTYAEPILKGNGPEGLESFIFNPIWLKWFVDLSSLLSKSGISDVASGTFKHDLLSNISGITTTTPPEYYHMTAGESGAFSQGKTSGGIFVLAKLTVGGTNGYIVFTNGIITDFNPST